VTRAEDWLFRKLAVNQKLLRFYERNFFYFTLGYILYDYLTKETIFLRSHKDKRFLKI